MIALLFFAFVKSTTPIMEPNKKEDTKMTLSATVIVLVILVTLVLSGY